MKRQMLVAAMLLSFFSTISFAVNDSYKIEEAMESDELEIRLASDLTGIIKGYRCDDCEHVLVKITPNTKLEIDGFKTSLSNIRKCSRNPTTVIYNIKSREVTSVSCER